MSEKKAVLSENIFAEDPMFIKIKKEFDPLIIGFFSIGKSNSRYRDFKECLDEWNNRLLKILPTIGTIESLQRIPFLFVSSKETEKSEKKLPTVISLFRYLGLVESFGSQFIDLTVLLLVANGYEFHVERQHDVPRIVHARKLKDLSNASLGVKLKFLERHNLRETSKIIDKDLRNSIAHLNLEIKDDGKVEAKSRGRRKEINIYEKIKEFNKRFQMLFFIFNEVQSHVFPPEKRLIIKNKKKATKKLNKV